MNKGVRALQNIQFLKWCKELGVTPIWYLLFGMPGEPQEEYERMARLIPLLAHLPPGHFAPIRLDRFSPHFVLAEQFGFTDITPRPAYHYIYPFEAQAIANLAYFFSYRYCRPQDVQGYTRSLVRQLIAWNECYPSSELLVLDRDPYLLLFDFRPVARKPLVVLTGLSRAVYLACDSIQTIAQLRQLARPNAGGQKVEALLSQLVEEGLMVAEGNSYLSLAIRLDEYQPDQAIRRRYENLLRQFEQSLRSFNFPAGAG
jgi:hypothetical protein